jgi:hypothetical protein
MFRDLTLGVAALAAMCASGHQVGKASEEGSLGNAGQLSSVSFVFQDEDTDWRWVRHNGRWWYWMPEGSWKVWINSRWIDYPSRDYTNATASYYGSYGSSYGYSSRSYGGYGSGGYYRGNSGSGYGGGSYGSGGPAIANPGFGGVATQMINGKPVDAQGRPALYNSQGKFVGGAYFSNGSRPSGNYGGGRGQSYGSSGGSRPYGNYGGGRSPSYGSSGGNRPSAGFGGGRGQSSGRPSGGSSRGRGR